MRFRIPTCAAALIAAGLGLSIGVPANAAIFDASSSTLTITYDPDTATSGGEITTIVGVDPDPSTPPDSAQALNGIANLNFANKIFGNGADFSQGAGGGDHSTLPGPNGLANIVYPYGMGVLQKNSSPSFIGPSELKLDFNFNWDLADGWAGPIFAYQFLSLAAAAPGTSMFSIVGDFTYTLNVGETSNTADIDFAQTLTGVNTPQSIFLFDSAILSFGSLPALILEEGFDLGVNTLNLSGTLTFITKNDTDPALVRTLGAEIGDNISADVLDLLNILLGLLDNGMAKEDYPIETQMLAMELFDMIQELRQTFGVGPDGPFNLGDEGPISLADLLLFNGGGIANSQVLSVVPLPGAFAMGLVGMAFLGARRKRRAA